MHILAAGRRAALAERKADKTAVRPPPSKGSFGLPADWQLSDLTDLKPSSTWDTRPSASGSSRQRAS